MESKGLPPRPERVETDDSLRAERDKTDEHLDELASTRDKDADDVVQLARERADDVLEKARETADSNRPGEVGERLSSARAAEDKALTGARAAADHKLANERTGEEGAKKLLLALEREETDDRLLTERARSDRAVASRDDFLAIVSHDVRGLLAGIAMSAEFLTRDSEPTQRPHIEGQRIRRLTGQMNRLVNDLLDVVSMESGKLTVERKRDDAARLIAETMETFQLATAARKIVMTYELPKEPVIASFDHDRILQVLTNLVGNAMKFTKPGGCINLVLATVDGSPRFTVTDTGCGIAADQVEGMFERFSQAAQNDRRGLGLGLYIARCIVEAHGGTIWATSDLGTGSAFHFTVPPLAA